MQGKYKISDQAAAQIKKSGFKQRFVVGQFGIQEAWYSRFLNGIQTVHLDDERVQKLSKFFKIPIRKLLTGVKEEDSNGEFKPGIGGELNPQKVEKEEV